MDGGGALTFESPRGDSPRGDVLAADLRQVDLSRVVVVGTSCAGKTTFAERLAQQLGSRHTQLDALYWLPGWQPRRSDDFGRRLQDLAAEERWVIDGNFGNWRDFLWPRATAAVWLNYAFPRIMLRALRRTTVRAVTKQPLYSGNRETIAKSFFSSDSILLWILRKHAPQKRTYRALFDGSDYPQLTRIEFTAPRQAERFLKERR